ncbi:MAG: N-acetylmuramoyl-L-alanine amidase [Ignavibacteria bacterium]|jgi:N-acetylmuramoyl-L-alanine amidase|nr:N-acetylmuramoyl-L-alanine amidase [Ignavibacteria bacterium]MCU7504882.1 N-acetylmuramoyl-L-alanine amidase [Ignavibacteria bacterium]MCU7517838.1 N-acetylmuramoyl-L-alanine amidase [Ignavibacteria bacterium]
MKALQFSSVMFFLVVFFGFACPVLSQNTGSKAPAIVVMDPGRDTTVTFSARFAISANTVPGSKVTINGTPYKVYPSGVFAGLLTLQMGENPFTITALTPSGQTLTKTFLIIRKKSMETTTRDSLVIEDAMMEPSRELWLNTGDVLRLSFKGTPGCNAYFGGGKGAWLPMVEVPDSETNGIKGIYHGLYKIKPMEVVPPTLVTFKLEDSTGKSITKVSKAKFAVMSNEFPLIAVTKGDRPYLNFGLGEDRLGGAKMGFLNPGIKLKIDGKAGNQYRVALSSSLEAWIPEDQLDFMPQGTYPPYSLTGSWSVYGDNKYDYVTVGLSEKLPYTSTQDPINHRLIIDVYGAVANSNWVTQQLSTKEIKNVYYEQPEKDVFRIIIELSHKQSWGYGIKYNGNNLVIKVKRQPEKLDIGKLTFVLDAGHGGSSLGAVGGTGSLEKEINLSTVLHLKELLEEEGATVILTRKDDSNVPNSERVKTVVNSGADILISIHANAPGSSSDPTQIKGISTYYKYIGFRPLSTFVYNQVLKTGLQANGNVGSFNFTLNSPTELPNVLVEQAFMTNPEDEMKLMDDGFRKELAKKIVKGVEDFLEYCEEN